MIFGPKLDSAKRKTSHGVVCEDRPRKATGDDLRDCLFAHTKHKREGHAARKDAGAEALSASWLPHAQLVHAAVRTACTKTCRLCDYFAFVPECGNESPSSCDFFAFVPSGDPEPSSNAAFQNCKVHFPSSETYRLHQCQILAHRPDPPGDIRRKNGHQIGSPLPTAGTKAKKSHELWPQKRTSGTEAKKSHSVPARMDAQVCVHVHDLAIGQKACRSAHAQGYGGRGSRSARTERSLLPPPRPPRKRFALRARRDRRNTPTGVPNKQHSCRLIFCPPGRS